VDSCPVRWAGHRAVVALPGEIDVTNSAQVSAALRQTLADGAVVLVADMTATTFCASDGVKALIDARAAAVAAGAQLRVAGVAPGSVVRRVLELTGADQLLDLYPSLDAALPGQRHPQADKN
jgi:anti-sigma B factor antagonist